MAVAFVLPEDKTLHVVQRHLQRVLMLGLHLWVFYLERDFCSGSIIRYLHHIKQVAVIAYNIHGQEATSQMVALRQSSVSRRCPKLFIDVIGLGLALTVPIGSCAESRPTWRRAIQRYAFFLFGFALLLVNASALTPLARRAYLRPKPASSCANPLPVSHL